MLSSAQIIRAMALSVYILALNACDDESTSDRSPEISATDTERDGTQTVGENSSGGES